jgi:hypothetical protein
MIILLILFLLIWVILLEYRFRKLIEMLCYNHNQMKKSILNRRIEIAEIHKNIPYDKEEQFTRDVYDDWLYEEDYK